MHYLSKTQICFCKSSNWKTFLCLCDAFECPTVACKAFYTIVLSSLSLLISYLFPQYSAAILDTILLPILPYLTIPSLAVLFCLNFSSFTAEVKGHIICSFSCLTPRIMSSHFLFSHGPVNVGVVLFVCQKNIHLYFKLHYAVYPWDKTCLLSQIPGFWAELNRASLKVGA